MAPEAVGISTGNAHRPGQGHPERHHQHQAAHRAVVHNSTQLRLPMVGEVVLPAPQSLAWYAGIATLAALEIIEWPVAIVLGIGHALVQDRHNKALEDFGKALEEA